MVDTTEIKEALKEEMKRYYRRKWAVKIADRTDFTADYIRRYFNSDITQETIAVSAQELIEEAKKSINDSIQRIKS